MTDGISGPVRQISLARKFFGVGALVLLLAIPLFAVFLLVWDRSQTAEQVRADIASGWAGAQELRGPYLVIPFERRQLETTLTNGKSESREVISRDALFIAADDLRFKAVLTPDVRKRSLFEVILYRSAVDIEARFVLPDLSALDLRFDQLQPAKAFVALSLDDAKGLGGSIPRLALDGRAVDLQPGARMASFPGSTFHAPVDASALPGQPIRLTAHLDLKGSTRFAVRSVARALAVTLSSPWPHPSFVGDLLPEKRDVGAKGFSGSWRTTYLAMNAPLSWLSSVGNRAENGPLSVAAVSLIEPVDLYGQASRAVKYGILFIALTFLAFFLFDVAGGRAISAVAYTLVGLGLVLFFLLLLALAEYISFSPAYLLAATALLVLITAYSKAVLKSVPRAAVIGGILAGLYIFLYILLQLDDYALLVGSLALFVALALLMYFTRHVDWRQPVSSLETRIDSD